MQGVRGTAEDRRLANNEKRKRWRLRNVERARNQVRDWRKANPERFKDAGRSLRLKKYGLTVEAFDALLAQQLGICACCGTATPGNRWHVDHDHATGAVRGIICGKCNTGLGLLGDTVEGVERALRYLKRSQS